MPKTSCILSILVAAILKAQAPDNPGENGSPAVLDRVMARLDRLEKQNQELMEELRAVRAELAKAQVAQVSPENTSASLSDRVDVVEKRVEEQSQTKVEAAQRFPVRLNGMLLFNAFTGDAPAGWYGTGTGGANRSGATVAQSLIGLDFDGPELPGNGRLTGSLSLDFLNGSGLYDYGLRLRRASVNFDWKRRSFLAGSEKPLISRRQPNSLAEVAYPPLANSGNPWVWVPQVRYTERIGGEQAGLDAEFSALQTDERYTFNPYGMNRLELTRPAFETRFNLWRRGSGERRFEIAPGFHLSTTHIAGFSVPSRMATLDWLIKPAKRVEVTGLLFGGQNMSTLGGFANGFVYRYGERPEVVKGLGGWAQVSFPLTPRLTLNAFGGFQAPRVDEFLTGAITHDATYAGNAIYRFAPNLLLAFEALQERTGYLGKNEATRNHYDLAIGYLF